MKLTRRELNIVFHALCKVQNPGVVVPGNADEIEELANKFLTAFDEVDYD